MPKKSKTTQKQGAVVAPVAIKKRKLIGDTSKERGRPDTYKKRYAEELVDYFLNFKGYDNILVKKEYFATGMIKSESFKPIVTDMPFFTAFGRKIGCGVTTLKRWRDKKDKEGNYVNPEFRTAYKRAKDIQKEFLIKTAMSGLVPPATYCFTAKNMTDMRDKVSVSNEPGESFSIKYGRMNDEELNKDFTNKIMALIKSIKKV